jgi:hypothetical protein
MCTFPKDWPNGCPPFDCMDASGGAYRIVKTSPCTADDFKTYAELGNGSAECKRSGLSVFSTFDGAAHCRAKYQNLGFYIAFATLAPEHGKTKAGHRQHLTWWPFEEVDRLSLFAVVDEP